jgi:hypothetical protein
MRRFPHLLPLFIHLVTCGTALAQTPSIVFSTYLGGTGAENLRDITTDSSGFVYVTGGTSSADFPTTPGAYDRTFASGGGSLGSGGPMDVFVTKYTPTGEVVWSTLIGGPNYDRAYAIEVDRQGYVYIAGRAGDSFPTTPGVVQERFAGDVTPNTAYGKQDPFVAKLSPDGSSLVWATYFGADDAGIIRDVDIDAQGNVYIASPGSSRPHPHITPGAFQTTKPGGNDMVVAKISADATRAIWATYLGGTAGDGGAPSIRVDRNGSAYIIASTSSTDLPVTATAFDRTFNGGQNDFVIARFAPDGASLVFCTYLGGSGNEDLETHNIALDEYGQAYISGYTSSPDLPVTPFALQGTYQGGLDIPLAKISADGSQLIACSYLGGSANDGSQGIALDTLGGLLVGGSTQSPNFPTTVGAVGRTLRGTSDAIAVRLTNDLTAFHYSTLVGGSDADDGRTAWMTLDGTFFVAGHTRSNDYPMVSAAQSARAGSEEGFLTKFAHPARRSEVRMRETCVVEDERSGSVAVILERTGDRSGALTVSVDVTGAATVGADYLLARTTARFNVGDSLALLPITILDDTLAEGAESIDVRITTTTDSATTIDAQSATTVWISDDERSGRNLLSDPGFESAGVGWQKTTNGGRAIVSTPTHRGSGSQQMILSPQFPREVFQTVAVVAGRTYFASGWMRLEGVSGTTATIEIDWLDASGATIARQTVGARNGTSEWSWSIACATAPPSADSARFRLAAGVEADSVGSVWFDDLELLDPTDQTSRVDAGSDLPIEHRAVVDDQGSVTFLVDVPAQSDVTVEIVDMRGERLYAKSVAVSGTNTIDCGARLPSGTYAYRIVVRTGGRTTLTQGSLVVGK